MEFQLLKEQKKFFIADFFHSQRKLIVELDGGIRNHKKEYDLDRTDILEELGFSIIRFSNEDVLSNWSAVEQKLLIAINNE